MQTTNNMKKIVILGCAGCGKSTLAKKLGSQLNIPVLHLDTIYWKANWKEEDSQIFLEKQIEMIKKDAWILDGNYRDTLDMRLKDCDTVIYLDYPRRTAIYGIYKRYFEYRNKPRDTIAEGCPEKIDKSFFKWVWNFRKNARPIIINKINEYKLEKEVLIFKRRRHLKKYLNVTLFF